VILILACPDAGADPAATGVEKEIEALAKRIRKELVLVHSSTTLTPTGS
jgi:hypothetical protein